MESSGLELKKSIGVALCVYNGSRFLAKQLDSILSQSKPPSQIVIVDDASEDESVDLIRAYEKKSSIIELHTNSINLGANKSFEIALSLMRTDYIAISDQDDLWAKDKLEVLLAHIGSHSLIYSDSTLIDDRDNSLGVNLSGQIIDIGRVKPYHWGYFLLKNCISGHALMMKRDLLSLALPFPKGLDTKEFVYDRWLGLCSSLQEGQVFVDKPLVFHRIHGGNTTNTGLITKRGWLERFKLLATRFSRGSMGVLVEGIGLIRGRVKNFKFSFFALVFSCYLLQPVLLFLLLIRYLGYFWLTKWIYSRCSN